MPDLSPVLARFVETMNARGSDGFVACFAGGAKVRDEGLLRGAAEIRARHGLPPSGPDGQAQSPGT